jgi:NhaP-type Na+/H+ or K+/H+ antiporter
MRWEGIMIDPIGAVLAVLVFEVISTAELQGSSGHFLRSLAAVSFGGVLIGFTGALLMTLFLSRYWIPDFLQNAVSLMMAMAIYTASNVVVEESGLLAVTIMGIGLANQQKYPVKHIIEFKESVRVLLIASLFVLLAARLTPQDLAQIGRGVSCFSPCYYSLPGHWRCLLPR